MSRGRVLYHLVRADFLERVRRYNFLATLAAAVYLGYCSITGKVIVRLDDYRGVYNSAWIGCLMTLVATMFLSLIGFYIVKNTIQRDQETRVGQILATTPMTKSFYTIAKTISNFAVLSAMVAVMALAALLMQFLKAEDTHVHLGALLSPFLLFALPAMAFTGAIAVLFETLPVLRGGAGNVIYFFVWTALIAVPVTPMANGGRVGSVTYFSDVTGLVSIMSQMQEDLRKIDPLYKNDAELTVGDRSSVKDVSLGGIAPSPCRLLEPRGVPAAFDCNRPGRCPLLPPFRSGEGVGLEKSAGRKRGCREWRTGSDRPSDANGDAFDASRAHGERNQFAANRAGGTKADAEGSSLVVVRDCRNYLYREHSFSSRCCGGRSGTSGVDLARAGVVADGNTGSAF